MPILNYTTKIDSHKTIMEITQMLSKAGATKIIIDNNEDTSGMPTQISFCIRLDNTTLLFALPCNYHGVRSAMNKNKKIPRSMCTDEQAQRVAWRILKDWVAAQLAIVEAEVAALPEVFLPYCVTKDGDTLYKNLIERKNHFNNALLLTQ